MSATSSLSDVRLQMRSLSLTDQTFLIGLLVDSQVRKYLGGPVAVDQLLPTLRRYLATAAAHPVWIVENGGRPCGLISLTPHKDGAAIELSYQFMPRVWGQGVGTAAGRFALNQAFGPLALPRVIAETQSANTASVALLRRLGMVESQRLTRFGAEQVIFTTTGANSTAS